jgi:DNA polymerase
MSLADLDPLAALRLQLDWGADEAIGDAALDRFAASPPARRPAAPQPASPAKSAPQARTLDALLAEMAAFEGCALRTTATQLVRPDGSSSAAVIVIGDAPGSDDDRSGRAFSGAAGQILDRVLAPIGLDRRSLLLATLVPWRPPGNRRLSEAEIQTCLPFLHRVLAIVRPRHALLLGIQTVRALTGEEMPIRRLRGRWLDVQVQDGQLTIAALALPTPDQWLTTPAAKQALWSDLVTLRRAVTTS